MKLLFTCFLAILANRAVAQKIRLMSEIAESERTTLVMKYATDGFKNENQLAMSTRMDSVVKMIFPAPPQKNGVAVYFDALVNKQGTVDHVLFDLYYTQKYNRDSLVSKFKEALAIQMSRYKAPTPGTPFMYNFSMSIGPLIMPREVRKGDSSVTDIPQAIACIDTLGVKRLFFNQLELQSIPAVIYRFPNLEELYLGKNELTELYLDMERLPRLEQLHLEANKITALGFRISKNKTLKILNLNENLIDGIPRSVGNCRRLTSLWLGGNKITKLSNASFKRLKWLEDLNLYKTGIASLPSGVGKMKRLQVIDLYHNNLRELPKGLFQLKKLTTLAVSHNQLTEIPKRIYKLKQLHTLYAHHNHLSKLPGKIGRLQAMTILDLGYNWFTDFPKEIIAFTKLEELELSANNFLKFPEELLEIRHLEKLFLRGNPFIEDTPNVTYSSQLDHLKSKNIEVFH